MKFCGGGRKPRLFIPILARKYYSQLKLTPGHAPDSKPYAPHTDTSAHQSKLLIAIEGVISDFNLTLVHLRVEECSKCNCWQAAGIIIAPTLYIVTLDGVLRKKNYENIHA